MLATEHDSADPAPEGVASPLLETWSTNDRMRHIPSASWMAGKLDLDVRRRIDHLFTPFADLSAADERQQVLEAAFRGLCRALERVCEVSRRPRSSAPHPPGDLGAKLPWLVTQAVSNLNSLDETFGRRLPFQTFERSNAEPLWAAMLMVFDHLGRITELVREIDPGIDDRLLEGLVNLTEPLRREPLA